MGGEEEGSSKTELPTEWRGALDGGAASPSPVVVVVAVVVVVFRESMRVAVIGAVAVLAAGLAAEGICCCHPWGEGKGGERCCCCRGIVACMPW